MMTKNGALHAGREKRNKNTIFQELLDKNEALGEACFILEELQVLIRTMPDKLRTGREQNIILTNSVLVLDDSLDKLMETAEVFFEEIEMKLNDIQKYLLHDDCGKTHHFTRVVFDILLAQEHIDALISNAEEEIYKFLETDY